MNQSGGRGRGRSATSSKPPFPRRGTEETVGGAQHVRSLPPLPVPRWLQQSPPPRSPEFPSLNEDGKEPKEPESDNREGEDSVKSCEMERKDSSIIGGITESLTKLSIDHTQASSSDSTLRSVDAHAVKQTQKSPRKPEYSQPPPVTKIPTTAPSRTKPECPSPPKSFKKVPKKQVPPSGYLNEWRKCPYFTLIMPHKHDMSIPENEYLFKCRAKYGQMKRRLGEEMDIAICDYHSAHHVPSSELEEHEKDCCFKK